MAVHSAALGISADVSGRFALMRPLHRQDAFRAHGSPIAFCRLMLHEALATSLRPGEETRADVRVEVFDHTKAWLHDACVTKVRLSARHDLKALADTYRSYAYLLRGDNERARYFLLAADTLLDQGEDRSEPRVTWWTFCASTERFAAVTQRSQRQHHLWRAEYFLRRALRRLPVVGHEERRAELLHDQAQVNLQLGATQLAGQQLARADVLLSGLGATAGPYLLAMVILGRAHAEAQMAASQATAAARYQAIRRTWAFYQRASGLECFDAEELAHEHQLLTLQLAPLDGTPEGTPPEGEVPS